MAPKRKRKTTEKNNDKRRRLVAYPDDRGQSISEDSGGDNAEADVAGEPPVIASRSVIHSNKPPTGRELQSIKDTTDLFRSSTFKLQIDALLPNVRPTQTGLPPLNFFLHSLHDFLTSLPVIVPAHPLEAAKKLPKGIAIPYVLPAPSPDTSWKVSFVPPRKGDIFLIGSWPNDVAVKRKDTESGMMAFVVDLAVEMHPSIFQEKDYRDARFFQKRAFYLAIIAAAISNSKSGFNVDVEYESVGGDPRLTVLVLTPRKDGSQSDFTRLHACVRVIPSMSTASSLSIMRLSPSHTNLRVDTDSEHQKAASPTPIYNNCLLLSYTPKPHLMSTHALIESTPAFQDALTLIRIWANQRGYGEGVKACVTGFEGKGTFWAALLGILVEGENPHGSSGRKRERKALGKGLSSYQLFRAALDFLATHDWEKVSILAKSTDPLRFEPEEFHSYHESVFLDSSSLVNLLAGVPLSSLEMLRHDAIKSLELLNANAIAEDPFADTFLNDQRELPTRFDTLVCVDLSGARLSNPSSLAIWDRGSVASVLLSSLATLLRQGLNNRTRAIAILHPTSKRRPISRAHPQGTPALIHIGLIHDPEHALRIVDHGPTVDHPDSSEAERFRHLWGEKAELRRFRDGRITESVVWDVQTSDDRAQIPAMILRHILTKHFGVSSDAVRVFQGSFDSVLRFPESVTRIHKAAGISGGFKAAIAALDDLGKHIRGLGTELPLSVSSITATSDALRHTSIFNPVPLPPSVVSRLPLGARYNAPMEIILQFERSTQWPDDLEAIQKLKLAFLERIADGLMRSMPGARATVVLSNAVHDTQIQDRYRLEIVTPAGWAFVARIWHDRESTLLDQVINNKVRPHIKRQLQDAESRRHRYQALRAKEVYSRRFIHGPRHHSAIANINHHFLAYSGTVRLVKRWLGSHWLGRDVSEEAIEIICAKIFICNGRNLETAAHFAHVPRSKERGFSLVVRFLKDWDWAQPVFVPLIGDSHGTHSEMSQSRSQGVWKLVTEMDATGKVWTEKGPDILAANRVQALAKATWEALQMISHHDIDLQRIFIHPIEDYDFVVKLNLAVLPQYAQNIDVDSNVLAQTHIGPQTDCQADDDPAALLFSDLKDIYQGTIRFFYDPAGGDMIGAVLDPCIQMPKPFKVFDQYSSIPTSAEHKKIKKKDKDVVVFNRAAVFQDIMRIGMGLIEKIII